MTRKGHCSVEKRRRESAQFCSRPRAAREPVGLQREKEREREQRTEKRSLRTEKQNAHGTGRPSGASTTHCIVMLVAVDSNACLANDS